MLLEKEELLSSIRQYIETYYIEEHPAVLCMEECKTLSAGFGRAPARRCQELCAAPTVAKATSLVEVLEQMDAGFTETLLRLIDEKGRRDPEIYKKANVSKQLFSKIRCNPLYRPTKATALAFALALELNLEQTKDLIGRAGYALSNSSKFDLIVRYCIEQGIYDVVQVNMVLYEFDQPLIGG